MMTPEKSVLGCAEASDDPTVNVALVALAFSIVRTFAPEMVAASDSEANAWLKPLIARVGVPVPDPASRTLVFTGRMLVFANTLDWNRISVRENVFVAEDAVERGAADAELTSGAEFVAAVEVEDILDVVLNDGVEVEGVGVRCGLERR